MFYSNSTKGFYDSEIHGNNIPEDAIEITIEEYQFLIDGQTNGKKISVVDGTPTLVNHTSVISSYTENREREYPPITDYLDAIVKGDQAQIDKYIADCQAVKAKYPKEN